MTTNSRAKNPLIWLRGSCRFSADGMFPERFLNLAARADLGLWDVKRTDKGLTACITAPKYRLLPPIARKCGLHLRVMSRFGLPFRLLPYRKRAGMPLGFIMFCGLILFLSMFVWYIELPELSPEVQPEFEQAVADAGLKPGVLRSHIDGQMIASELELSVKELSWAGLCVNGSRVIVDAKELEKVAPPLDRSQPCNIVASKGGVVVSALSGAGELLVSENMTVAPGDLLVSGVIELEGGSVIIEHAEGDIFARVDYTLTSSVPFNYRSADRTGRVVTVRRLSLFGAELPLYFGSMPDGRFERECDEWQLKLGDTGLPLKLRTEQWYELGYVNRLLTADEAAAIALEDVEGQISQITCREIISRSDDYTETQESVILTTKLTVVENIAQQEIIEID